jgi:hypothetical protein
LYQGTTSVVPQPAKKIRAFSPCLAKPAHNTSSEAMLSSSAAVFAS